MNVAGYSHILYGSTDFQHIAHLAFIKHVGWHPNAVDKIEVLQQAREMVIFSEMPQSGFAHKNAHKVPFFIPGQDIYIIFCDELMGFGHGRFRFMAVLTLCQGHEFLDPHHDFIPGAW